VIFKSTSAKITKEAAIKSIGDQKDTYVVEEIKIATAEKK
jgi:hypothetical protein